MLIDREQAIAECGKLNLAAAECQNILDKMDQIIDELPAIWEGVSANKFIQNNRYVIERLKTSKCEMLQIADEIKLLVVMSE